MKYILGLLLSVSFNANACYVVNGYVQCPPTPPVVYIPSPIAPVTPGTAPVTIDFGQAKVIKYSIPALIYRGSKIAINIDVVRKHPKILSRHNSEFYLWTVNSEEDLMWIKDKKLSGVITDDVKKARKVLEASASR